MSAAASLDVLHTTRISPAEFTEYGVRSTSKEHVVIQWCRTFDSPTDEKLHAKAIIAIMNINASNCQMKGSGDLAKSGVVSISYTLLDSKVSAATSSKK